MFEIALPVKKNPGKTGFWTFKTEYREGVEVGPLLHCSKQFLIINLAGFRESPMDCEQSKRRLQAQLRQARCTEGPPPLRFRQFPTPLLWDFPTLLRGGGPPPKVYEIPSTSADEALYYSTIFLTLVTWVPQNRQGKLHPSLRGFSAPPPFKWGS